jgi:ComF family protein
LSAFRGIKQWLDTGLGFIYPEACQICGHERATPSDGFVCAACAHQVRLIEPPFCQRCGLPYEGDISSVFQCANCREMDLQFGSARSAVLARDMVLDVIHRYKYQQALWFEPFLAGLLIRQAVPQLASGHWDVIVPVPLHPAKRRERGFNQAEGLALRLSRATRIPVDRRLLRRIVPTQTQTQLSRPARAANVRDAFALRPGHELARGKRVVLVDDVLTTGATTSACAGVLRSAGAGEVCVWTVARGL